jgi:predicted RNase H-like HicB family nuclease
MVLDDYKVVLYRNQPDGWVAEIPAIQGCYALMPTREQALAELSNVFEMIAAEYQEKGLSLPADSTAIVNAWRQGRGLPSRRSPARFRNGAARPGAMNAGFMRTAVRLLFQSTTAVK